MAAKKEGAPKVAHGKSWLIPLLVSVVGATLAGGGAAWFLVSRAAPPAAATTEAEAGEQKPKAPAQYVSITPAFVVNLADENETRYLQVEIEVMTRDEKVVKEVATHLPMIRNRLLLLFSQQRASELRTREDKERLQELALQEVQNVLQEQSGGPGIDALLFTSFVTQ